MLPKIYHYTGKVVKLNRENLFLAEFTLILQNIERGLLYLKLPEPSSEVRICSAFYMYVSYICTYICTYIYIYVCSAI